MKMLRGALLVTLVCGSASAFGAGSSAWHCERINNYDVRLAPVQVAGVAAGYKLTIQDFGGQPLAQALNLDAWQAEYRYVTLSTEFRIDECQVQDQGFHCAAQGEREALIDGPAVQTTLHDIDFTLSRKTPGNAFSDWAFTYSLGSTAGLVSDKAGFSASKCQN